MQQFRISKWSPFLGVLAVMGLLGAPSVNAGWGGGRSLSGIWKTRVPAPFIMVQPETGATPQFTDMTWTLSEDEDGLVTGVNSYVSSDASGENPTEGSLCMVGARDRSRFVLSEGRLGEPDIPIVVFDCEMRGRNRIRCLGSSLSTLPPLTLQAVLVRSNHNRVAEDSDEGPSPELCIPTASETP